MTVKYADCPARKPRLAQRRPDMDFDLPEVEAFLQLPPEERLRRRREVSKLFREVYAGVTVADLLIEKRRESEREN